VLNLNAVVEWRWRWRRRVGIEEGKERGTENGRTGRGNSPPDPRSQMNRNTYVYTRVTSGTRSFANGLASESGNSRGQEREGS